ncbi:MAG: efflux RND transporter periplasmic adaptor subunit, partial [Planctomycetaceae bacterium]|nr:efflux RND transporter periplasmic adaptor subunit [Planctomycetaceae bacterium]
RLGSLQVRVGDRVQAGAELAYLESRTLAQAERDLAQSQLDDARTRLEAEQTVAATTVAAAELGVEETRLQQHDIANQEARVGLARANVELIAKELARLTGLSTEIVPPQELDQKRLLERQAQEELRVAETLLAKLKAGASLAERAALGKLQAAQANARLLTAGGGIASLEQTVRLSQARLDRTVVRAPHAGQILEILTHPGEMLSQRPILQMADTSQMQVVAEVYETDIAHVRLGQKAIASSRALAAPLAGKVVEIGSLVAQNEVQSLTASTPSAQRVVKVRIQLDDSAAAARLINLQVDVQFLGGNEVAQAGR